VAAIAAVGMALAAAAPAWAADLLSLRDFREAYVAALKTADPAVKIEAVTDDELKVTAADGKSLTAFLGNAYNAYRQNPEELNNILQHYTGVAVSALSEPTMTADKLVVLVRPEGYGEAMFARAPKGTVNPRPLSRPLAPGLSLYVAVDQPQSFVIPQASDLRDKLKLTDEQIWATALANTHRRLPDHLTEQQGMTVLTGLEVSPSLMAFDAFWDSPDMQKGGPPVVSPYGRDSLLVVHGDKPGVIEALHKAALEGKDTPDALTDAIYVRRQGHWVQAAP
jgi:hypothetical protein